MLTSKSTHYKTKRDLEYANKNLKEDVDTLKASTAMATIVSCHIYFLHYTDHIET